MRNVLTHKSSNARGASVHVVTWADRDGKRHTRTVPTDLASPMGDRDALAVQKVFPGATVTLRGEFPPTGRRTWPTRAWDVSPRPDLD
jgi:hypothetical protein